MATNPIQQLVDSGMQFTEMQRQQAEKLVGQWVSAGEVRRADAERTVQTLIDWGKQTTRRSPRSCSARSASSWRGSPTASTTSRTRWRGS